MWGSITPGHPEHGVTPGVETTTGPLGQGLANSVGMAIAERYLAARYNRPGHAIVDHYTYGICGDGDLMEGVSSEAASLAGHLGLGKLIYLYDSNRITIDGSTDLAFTEDVGQRFEAYGWHVQHVDGYDHAAIGAAIRAAQAESRPAVPDYRAHAHRHVRPHQAGLGQLPRLAAGPGRGRQDQGAHRLAGGAQVLRPGRGLRQLPATAG